MCRNIQSARKLNCVMKTLSAGPELAPTHYKHLSLLVLTIKPGHQPMISSSLDPEPATILYKAMRQCFIEISGEIFFTNPLPTGSLLAPGGPKQQRDLGSE